MNRAREVALVWLALVLLAGCQMFQPQTIEEGIGAAYVSIAASADTTTARLKAGAITTDQAARISERLHQAKMGVDTATAAIATGNEVEGQESLGAAIALLTALEQEMGR